PGPDPLQGIVMHLADPVVAVVVARPLPGRVTDRRVAAVSPRQMVRAAPLVGVDHRPLQRRAFDLRLPRGLVSGPDHLPPDLTRVAADHPGERLEVFFEDEARFGQQGTITRVWAPRGSRPRAVRQTQYTYLFVMVAIRAATGSASALIMPELNAAVVNLFLEQFGRERPAGVHA